MKDHRFYSLPDGKSVPSVTTILDVVGKPGLISWAANLERELICNLAARIYDSTPVGASAAWYRQHLEKSLPPQRAHEAVLSQAGEIGTQVHGAIEHATTGTGDRQPLAGPAAFAYQAWLRWRGIVKPRILLTECTVWSRQHGYAGTLDMLAEVTLPIYGRLTCVLDWKTSRKYYPEHGYQIAAYGQALHEMGHCAEMPHGIVVRLPKDDPAGEADYKLLTPAEMARAFACFLAAKTIFDDQAPVRADQILPDKTRKPAAGTAFGFAA